MSGRCTMRNESCGNRLNRWRPKPQIKLWFDVWTRSKVSRASAALVRTRWAEPQRLETLSRRRRRHLPNELPCAFDVLLAVPVPKKPIRANPNESLRRDVHQKATQKLLRLECAHRLVTLAFRGPTPERHLMVLVRLDPIIGDGDSVHIPRQILKKLLRSAERRLRVHLPSTRLQARKQFMDPHCGWQTIKATVLRGCL